MLSAIVSSTHKVLWTGRIKVSKVASLLSFPGTRLMVTELENIILDNK